MGIISKNTNLQRNNGRISFFTRLRQNGNWKNNQDWDKNVPKNTGYSDSFSAARGLIMNWVKINVQICFDKFFRVWNTAEQILQLYFKFKCCSWWRLKRFCSLYVAGQSGHLIVFGLCILLCNFSWAARINALPHSEQRWSPIVQWWERYQIWNKAKGFRIERISLTLVWMSD